MNIKFLKSSLFKGKITTKGKEGYKESIETWERMVREEGYLTKKHSTLITPKITVQKKKIKIKKNNSVIKEGNENEAQYEKQGDFASSEESLE